MKKKINKNDQSYIFVQNAREHNLKNVTINIPKKKLVVVTGVSGSGKSSLAFGVIFREGQRRYLSSFSSYARQFVESVEKPEVDLLEGISPPICIDQKSVSKNPRSTVGTITEVYDFLRLLFARLGIAYCPNGHGKIENQSIETIIERIYNQKLNEPILILSPVIIDRKGEYRKEIEKYRQDGFVRIIIDGKLYRLEEDIVLSRYEKHTIEVVIDRLKVNVENRLRIEQAIYKAVEISKGKVSVVNYNKKSLEEKKSNKQYLENDNYVLFSVLNACKVCGESIPEVQPNLFSFNSLKNACKDCEGIGYIQSFCEQKIILDESKSIFQKAIFGLNDYGNIVYAFNGRDEIIKIFERYKIDIETPWNKLPNLFKKSLLYGDEVNSFSLLNQLEIVYKKNNCMSFFRKYLQENICQTCKGSGLNLIALNFTFNGKTIYDYNKMKIEDLFKEFQGIKIEENNQLIWKPIYKEIYERLLFLNKVGLGYLNLNRKANTLSGGESQRIRLASQVGSGLTGCLYILDEPSIGLHHVDNQKLIQTLQDLRDKDNSVIVIEHDEDTMLAADHLIEVGPKAGHEGGQIIFNDKPINIFKSLENRKDQEKENTSNITTIDFLVGNKIIPIPLKRRNFNQYIRI